MSSVRTDITVNGADITVPRNPIPLYRDVAKINVRVDIDPDSDEKFDLTQIILVNYNTETFAVPSPELTAMWNDPDLTPAQRVDRPLFASDVVRSGTNFIKPPENSITYAGPGDEAEISTDQQTCIDEIFTFERLAWEDGRHLCLIVQGNVTIDGVRRTAPGTSTTATLVLTANTDTDARVAKLKLTAGNLQKYVTVRQATLTKITVRYVDADDKNTEIRHSDTHIVVPDCTRTMLLPKSFMRVLAMGTGISMTQTATDRPRE